VTSRTNQALTCGKLAASGTHALCAEGQLGAVGQVTVHLLIDVSAVGVRWYSQRSRLEGVFGVARRCQDTAEQAN